MHISARNHGTLARRGQRPRRTARSILPIHAFGLAGTADQWLRSLHKTPAVSTRLNPTIHDNSANLESSLLSICPSLFSRPLSLVSKLATSSDASRALSAGA